jgi:hypothetical protein
VLFFGQLVARTGELILQAGKLLAQLMLAIRRLGDSFIACCAQLVEVRDQATVLALELCDARPIRVLLGWLRLLLRLTRLAPYRGFPEFELDRLSLQLPPGAGASAARHLGKVLFVEVSTRPRFSRAGHLVVKRGDGRRQPGNVNLVGAAIVRVDEVSDVRLLGAVLFGYVDRRPRIARA